MVVPEAVEEVEAVWSVEAVVLAGEVVKSINIRTNINPSSIRKES